MRKSIQILLLASLLGLGISGYAWAGPWEDAKAANQRGDFATELRLMLPFAKSGNLRAQYNVGQILLQGTGGVQKNLVNSAFWFRLAAERGFAPAQKKLGNAYFAGGGVPQDYVSAHMWWNLAASKGDREAAYLRDALTRQYLTSEQLREAQQLARGWRPN
jgi:TPR repeat protein